MSFKIIIH